MTKEKSLVGYWFKEQLIIEDDGIFIRLKDGTVYSRLVGGGFG
jgi:hypothetical protein